MRRATTAQATVPTAVAREAELGDLRFRALLSDEDWAALPLSIRRRFTKRLAAGRITVFVGEVFETWMSRIGWCVAQAARLIGAPLPLTRGLHLPSVVAVSEDAATGGQTWTRIYARPTGFPQVVHSFKRFGGSTGLEEHVGCGVGMALTLHVVDEALVFRSTRYFIHVFGLRLALPGWMTPGDLSVIHAELGDGRFSFTLQLVHPRFGLIMRQMAAFREAERLCGATESERAFGLHVVPGAAR